MAALSLYLLLGQYSVGPPPQHHRLLQASFSFCHTVRATTCSLVDPLNGTSRLLGDAWHICKASIGRVQSPAPLCRVGGKHGGAGQPAGEEQFCRWSHQRDSWQLPCLKEVTHSSCLLYHSGSGKGSRLEDYHCKLSSDQTVRRCDECATTTQQLLWKSIHWLTGPLTLWWQQPAISMMATLLLYCAQLWTMKHELILKCQLTGQQYKEVIYTAVHFCCSLWLINIMIGWSPYLIG